MASENKVSSMTAFAQCRIADDTGTLTGELRAVNSRFFELNLRLPENLRGIEPQIREMLREVLSRGKMDLSLRFETSTQACSLELNKNLVNALLEACQTLNKNDTVPMNINMLDILRWPGALITSEHNQKQLEQTALQLVAQLLQAFQTDRAREGSALQKTIENRLATIGDHLAQIKPHAAQIMQAQREKLLDRLNQLKIEVDKNRLEQELIYWAQKTDIAEELDRLQTHVDEIKSSLKKGGAVGRRLDFLVQELHREANTLGAKASTNALTHHSVEMKVLIEQIREQVQNLE